MINYIVVPLVWLQDEHIPHCEQNSLGSVRTNLAKTHCILSYRGTKPVVFASFKELSQSKALQLMNTWQWNANTPRPWWDFWSK